MSARADASRLRAGIAAVKAEAQAELIERLKYEKSAAEQRAHQAERRAHAAEALRESLFGLTRPALDVPHWTAAPKRSKRSDHVPVLVLSDFHWGERISAERLAGANEYSIALAEERYRRVITQSIDIAKNHLSGNTYPGLIVLRLGDMVSGEIHADLRESNELQSAPAVRSLVGAETWGLRALADAFGHVHVISVQGNHGRFTPKPQHKRGAHDSLDAIASWWLEASFAGDKRLSFHTPASGDAVFLVYGRRYMATHGDRIGSRGGQGFIGPAATIMRGMKQRCDQYAAQGLPLSAMFVGHFHVALRLEYGWSNGSLPGFGEYARDGGMRPAPPVQWLLFFHERYGVTSQWEVRAAPAPTISASEELRPFEVRP